MERAIFCAALLLPTRPRFEPREPSPASAEEITRTAWSKRLGFLAAPPVGNVKYFFWTFFVNPCKECLPNKSRVAGKARSVQIRNYQPGRIIGANAKKKSFSVYYFAALQAQRRSRAIPARFVKRGRKISKKL
ncbi:MAG: hypothetical protein P4L43_10350 [Syntrophobacteraceae bacterium]|nr:hypothetical protein [Syntrophobacteraceae bacterium]